MVLRHEAERLGIRPDTTEIATAVKVLPAFGGEKGFDLARYTDFTDHALAPMGFSEGANRGVRGRPNHSLSR